MHVLPDRQPCDRVIIPAASPGSAGWRPISLSRAQTFFNESFYRPNIPSLLNQKNFVSPVDVLFSNKQQGWLHLSAYLFHF